MKSEKCWAILRKSSNQFLFQPSNDSSCRRDGCRFERRFRNSSSRDFGDTPHHVSYYESGDGVLFLGKTQGGLHEDLKVTLPATPPPIMLDKPLESLKTGLGLTLKFYVTRISVWRTTQLKSGGHMEPA